MMYLYSKYSTLADQHGFIVVYPSSTHTTKCFDVSSEKALQRNGGSDPQGIENAESWEIFKPLINCFV